MQNKHSYPEHEMKYFFKVLAKEPKKWWLYEHTRFFKYPRWNSGTVLVPVYKDELGYKLGTGKNCNLTFLYPRSI